MNFVKIVGLSILLFACQDTALRFVCEEASQCVVPEHPIAKCIKIEALPAACAFPSSTCSSEYIYDQSASDQRGGKCVEFRDLKSFSWTLENSGVSAGFNAVWGSSENDVYVVGAAEPNKPQGTILHSTGDGVWTKEPPSGLGMINDVWGSGSKDIYTVGEEGNVAHSSGSKIWSPHQSNTNSYLSSIWGISADDVYIVGTAVTDNVASGTILHSSSLGQWTKTTSLAILTGIWGGSSSNIFAVGAECGVAKCGSSGFDSLILHSTSGFAGFNSQKIKDSILRTIYGTQEDIYAAGSDGKMVFGKIYKFASGNWVLQTDAVPAVWKLWVSPSKEVFATHSLAQKISYSSGDGFWTTTTISDVHNEVLLGVWGSSPNNIYIVGTGGLILHGRR